MTALQVGIGDRVRWTVNGKDHEAVVVILAGDRLTARCCDTGELMAMALGDYLEVLGQTPFKVEARESLLWDLIDPEEIRRVEALAEHIREIESGFKAGHPTDDQPEPNPNYSEKITKGQRVENKVAELAALGKDSIVGKRGKSTLELDRRKYREGGLEALVDKRATRTDAETVHDLDQEVRELIQEAIESRSRKSTTTKKAFLDEIVRLAERSEPPIKLPGETRLRAAVDELDRGRYTFGASRTRRSAAAKPRGNYTRADAYYPGQWVQLDSTTIDLQVIGRNGRLCRPDLSIAVDVATRSIIGWVLVEGSTKASDIAAMLAGCFTPTPMREHWRDSIKFSYLSLPIDRAVKFDERLAAAAALPPIRPHNVVLDNGADYVSALVAENLARLGCGVTYSRPASAWDKAIVERSFKSINQALWARLPGYTGGNVVDRGTDPEELLEWGPIPDVENDPTKTDAESAMAFAEADDRFKKGFLNTAQVRELFATYLTHCWQTRPHAGLRIPTAAEIDVSPNDAYDYHVAVNGYHVLPPSRVSYFDLLPTDWRSIQPEGVKFQGRHYDSEHLRDRLLKSAFKKRKNKHPFKYDPNDATHIYLYDEIDERWVHVPWIHNKDLKRPFSARTWKWIANYVERRNKAEDALTLEALARDELRDFLRRFERGELTKQVEIDIAEENEHATGVAGGNKPPAIETDEAEVSDLTGGADDELPDLDTTEPTS